MDYFSNGAPSPAITPGWHAPVEVWDGREVRQYVDGLRTNTSATSSTSSCTIYLYGRLFHCKRASSSGPPASSKSPERAIVRASGITRHPELP